MSKSSLIITLDKSTTPEQMATLKKEMEKSNIDIVQTYESAVKGFSVNVPDSALAFITLLEENGHEGTPVLIEADGPVSINAKGSLTALGGKHPDGHSVLILTLEKDTTPEQMASLKKELEKSNIEVVHTYESAIKGFSVKVPDSAVAFISLLKENGHEGKNVDIEPDQLVSINAKQTLGF